MKTDPYKSALAGMGAGIVVWLVLFLPMTTFLIQPSINSIITVLAMESQKALLSEDLHQSIKIFHLRQLGSI